MQLDGLVAYLPREVGARELRHARGRGIEAALRVEQQAVVDKAAIHADGSLHVRQLVLHHLLGEEGLSKGLALAAPLPRGLER
eukprot:4671790-Prymnesium_polylepis.1